MFGKTDVICSTEIVILKEIDGWWQKINRPADFLPTVLITIVLKYGMFSFEKINNFYRNKVFFCNFDCVWEAFLNVLFAVYIFLSNSGLCLWYLNSKFVFTPIAMISLLLLLEGVRVKVIEYAEDLAIASGNIPSTLRDILKRALNITARWTHKNSLGANLTKKKQNWFCLTGNAKRLFYNPFH